MKKLIAAFVCVVAISASAFANPLAENVNYKTLNNFKQQFTEAENVNWKISTDFVKASFIMDGKSYEAFYNTDGDLIGLSKVMDFNKLPKAALKTIAKKYPYPPYKLEECVSFTTGEGDTNYYVSFVTPDEKLVLQVSPSGVVNEFKKIKK